MPEWIKNLAIALVSIFVTYLVQQYTYLEKNKIKKLDVYTKFNSNFISKPKFPNSNIKLLIDDIEKSKLGLYEISLLNYSNSTLKDMPIHIKLTPENVNEFKVLTYYATGEKNIDSLVKEIKPTSFDGTSYLFSYNIETLNRTDKDNSAFTLNILFEGKKEPTIEVVAIGINTQKFSWEHSPFQQNITKKAIILLISLILLFILLFIFIIGPLIAFLTKPFDRKSDKAYAKKIYETIVNENLLEEFNESKQKLFVQNMLFKQRMAIWDSNTKLSKWF